MPTAYSPAPAVQSIAEDLITKHHRHLMMADLKYVFRAKAGKKGAKTCLGKARRVSGLNAFLSTGETDDNDAPVAFFVIEIAEDAWEELTDSQRVALVDHELMHCGVEISDKDGSVKLGVIPHDLEAFRAEVERHGLWQPDIANFVSSARQKSLFEADEDPPVVESTPGIDSARARLVREPTGPPVDMPELDERAASDDRANVDSGTGEISVPALDPQDLADAINADPTLEAEVSAEVLDEEYERLDSPALPSSNTPITTDKEEPVPQPVPEGVIENLANVEAERIEPEPIPAEVRAAARPNSNGGPKVIHFDPTDVDDLTPPAAKERESLYAGARDSTLQAFLNE